MTAHIQSQAAVNCNHFNYLQYIFLRIQVVKDFLKGSTFLRFRGSIFQTVCYSCCMIWFQLLFPSLFQRFLWLEGATLALVAFLAVPTRSTGGKSASVYLALAFWLLSGLINLENKYASSSGSGATLGKGGGRVVLCVLPNLGWEVRVRAGSACLHPQASQAEKHVLRSRLSECPGKASKSRICAALFLLTRCLLLQSPSLDTGRWIWCLSGDEEDLEKRSAIPAWAECKGRLVSPRPISRIKINPDLYTNIASWVFIILIWEEMSSCQANSTPHLTSHSCAGPGPEQPRGQFPSCRYYICEMSFC